MRTDSGVLTMKTIVYKRPDGGVSIMKPYGDDPDKALERLRQFIPPDAIDVQEMDVADVPEDRTFRDAWRLSGGKIAHDMEHCRAIHRDHLRALRAPKLAALDVEYQRADEAGDAARKSSIAARKQALRDVTADPRIDAATTPEELKMVTPEALR